MTNKEISDAIISICNGTVDCEKLFETLCVNGVWKYDLEESDCMIGFSRTWVEYKIKVWLILKKYIISPPFNETEDIDYIMAGKFLQTSHQNTSIVSEKYDINDSAYYHAKYGDINSNLELEEIMLEELPTTILEELFLELKNSIQNSKK